MLFNFEKIWYNRYIIRFRRRSIMALFRKVPSDDQKGKVSYNAGIVSSIVSLAVSEVEGVELLAGKKTRHQAVF